MSENKVVYYDYVTIDGKEPEVNKSFFISKRFKIIMYSLGVIAGIIVYFVVAHI